MYTKDTRTNLTAPASPGTAKLSARPWAAALWRAGAAFLLSRAALPGGASPFALGLLAASGHGTAGALALFGLAVGYLTGAALVDALRYIATGMLIFSAAFAFYDLKAYRTGWFAPLVSVLSAAGTGAVTLSVGGWEQEEVLTLGAEALLTGTACWLFLGLASPKGARRRGGMLCLLSGLTAAAGTVSLPLIGSPAPMLASALTLCAARRGSGPGAVTGAACGAVLTGFSGDALTGALALGGAVTGWEALPRGWGWRVLFGAAAGASVLFLCGDTLLPAGLYAAGAAIALLLPESSRRAVDSRTGETQTMRLRPPEDAVRPRPLEESARYRLEEQSAALVSLYEKLRRDLQDNPTGENGRAVFERAAQRVCAACPQAERCWKREPLATWEDLNGVLDRMRARGAAEAEDYPERFRSACLSFERFRTTANEELFAYWTRRQYRMRLRESRAAVCRQYAQAALLLREAAETLGEELRFEATGASAARRALHALGFRGRTGLWLDRRGRRVLVVSGAGTEGLNSPVALRRLGTALGVPVELWESEPASDGETRLTFREAPPLTAQVGIALRCRSGQTVSGDSGAWFQDEGGTLWVILCDGMGSGEAAAKESKLVLNLVEDFLHAHIEPEAALTTLTSALALRGEVDGGFTTVDLFQLDLFTGAGSLYKLGGAPSYLRQKGGVTRVNGGALPAGLGAGPENRPQVTHARLGAGDCAVLVTDGITDGVGDFWLRTLLESRKSGAARELAEEILRSPQTRKSDDCTAAVVELRKTG